MNRPVKEPVDLMAGWEALSPLIPNMAVADLFAFYGLSDPAIQLMRELGIWYYRLPTKHPWLRRVVSPHGECTAAYRFVIHRKGLVMNYAYTICVGKWHQYHYLMNRLHSYIVASDMFSLEKEVEPDPDVVKTTLFTNNAVRRCRATPVDWSKVDPSQLEKEEIPYNSFICGPLQTIESIK